MSIVPLLLAASWALSPSLDRSVPSLRAICGCCSLNNNKYLPELRSRSHLISHLPAVWKHRWRLKPRGERPRTRTARGELQNGAALLPARDLFDFLLQRSGAPQFTPLCFRAVPVRAASLVRFGPCPRAPRIVLAWRARAPRASGSKAVQLVLGGRARDDGTDSESSDGEDGKVRMSDEERRTLRRKIREMLDRVPETRELTDPEERKAKMRELLTKYEMVVEEEDPDWPEDAEDGMGFSLDQFFDKITIKAEKKDDDDDEDAGYRSSDKEIVWEDDNYIKPIRDVKTKDWDDTVFTDFGPLIVLVHNRYKRPQENEMARAELVKAIEMFWEYNLPSPRCVAVDACAEPDLVDALKVSGFPEVLFTNAGRILHRDKAVRSAEEWSRMMAFFYYKAARPPCLSEADGQGQEKVPLLS